MKWSRVAILLVLSAGAAACFAAATKSPKPTRLSSKMATDAATAESLGIGSVDASGFFHHTGAYPPLALLWQADDRVKQVEGVFPHPVLPDRVLAATRGGLLLSEDAGATWSALAEASADHIGVVRGIAFSPDVPDTFFAATDHKGVWATQDCGKTFKQVGSKQSGLASDDTVLILYYPHDRRFRTLLVAHAGAAPGISFSRDGGASWQVVAPDYFVRQIVGGNAGDRELYIVAAKKSTPDIQSIYYCVSFDDFWLELMHDVIPTDAAVSVLVRTGAWIEDAFRGAAMYLATADAGLHRVTQGGGMKVEPETPATLLGVGCTWGPHADSEVDFVYEPKKLGMLVSANYWKTSAPQSAGLYTGAFVKEGARIRASANGTVFFASINDVLYAGRRRPGPIEVSRVTVTPAIFTYEDEAYKGAARGTTDALRAVAGAKLAAVEARKFIQTTREAKAFLSDTELTIAAKVAVKGDGPDSVTVDLSRLGGSPVTPMFDDGRHKDVAADDGVWAVQFRFDPRHLKNDNRDVRRRWPGPMGLTVTATGDGGAIAGAVGVLAVYDRPESFNISGRKVAPIVVEGKPWEKSFGTGDRPVDISGFHALTFWIKTDAEGAEEVSVRLRDDQPFSGSTSTPPVPILQEKFIEGGKVTLGWHLVSIPLARLLKDVGKFETSRLGAVVVSGEGKLTGNYWIDEVRFHISPESLKTYEGANTP
ncbi:MAG: hypothetical protein NT049_01010 [Planctomycetota bacterium]|nr:hypothetical protein [Planctomycetota bacterium]